MCIRDSLVTAQRASFYKWLATAQELPQTASPGPGDYMQVYETLAGAEGVREIVSIHMTAEGSGAYQAARVAASMIGEQRPDLKIAVIDTRNVAMCQGWMAIEAARAARQGKSLTDVVALVERMLDLPKPEQYLTGVRDVRFLGAMASPRLLSAFARICSGRIHIGYGSTELGRIFAGVFDAGQPMAAGHVGRLYADVEFRFLDDTGHPSATEGELSLRPPPDALPLDYPSGLPLGDADGWIATGDLGRRLPDGCIVLSGRKSELLNIGGIKRAPLVFEHLLRGFPGLADIAAFARAHRKGMTIPEWGVAYPGRNGNGDNPFFITAMRTWMRQNADVLVLENYFNDPVGHVRSDLWGGQNPKAAAAYRKAW